jgi:hypothetical protein
LTNNKKIIMERDDIIEYSLDAHHSEEQGVKLRKTIWKVTVNSVNYYRQ